MARVFETVSEELLQAAELIADDFEDRGFAVYVEKEKLGFPYTPTLVCKRQNTTLIVELDSKPNHSRLDDWVRYGCSCGSDTRVALCLPATTIVTAVEADRLKTKKVGLYVAHEEKVVEQIPASDLALNVQL